MPEIIEKAKDFVKGLKSVDGALVVGSAAYGGLAHLLHGVPYSPKDFDFIVDSMKRPVCSPAGYIISSNTFGNFKFSIFKTGFGCRS